MANQVVIGQPFEGETLHQNQVQGISLGLLLAWHSCAPCLSTHVGQTRQEQGKQDCVQSARKTAFRTVCYPFSDNLAEPVVQSVCKAEAVDCILPTQRHKLGFQTLQSFLASLPLPVCYSYPLRVYSAL